MERRRFLKSSLIKGVTVAAYPFVIIKPTPSDKFKRIGLTTVVFRERFKASTHNSTLTLNDIPEYFADRFKIHNVEFWSRHFESKSPTYVADVKKRLKKHNSTLINIQVDTKNDLSDPDEEIRMKGVMEMKEWVDVGADLNVNYIRISSMKKSYNQAVKSTIEINDFAKRKGVTALIENHMDLFSNVDNHLKLIKDIPDKNLGLLADFGNYSDNINQYEALEMIAPYTRLVSAKTKDFNESMEHISYDFGKCVDLIEKSNYRGIYSLEQWGKSNPAYDYEKITDWMIEQVKERI